MPLFERSGQSQRLNAAGQRYLSMVEPAIDAIQRASVMIGQGDQNQLKVATSHSFAAAWLMPRLADLHRHHGIDVEIVPTREFDALRSGERSAEHTSEIPSLTRIPYAVFCLKTKINL